MNNLFGELPKLFQRRRRTAETLEQSDNSQDFIRKFRQQDFPKDDLLTLQKLVDMEKSDLYDVLEYVFNGDYIAMTREARAKAAEATIFALLNDRESCINLYC